MPNCLAITQCLSTMMLKAIIIGLVVAGAFCEKSSTDAEKENIGKAYGNDYYGGSGVPSNDPGYGGSGGSNGPAWGPSGPGWGQGGQGWGPAGPAWGPGVPSGPGGPGGWGPGWGFPNRPQYPPVFDTNYCSLSGSFALAHESEVSSDGGNSGPYGSNSSPGSQKRHYSRQFCRFIATSNAKDCTACCQVAARAVNTSPDSVKGAILFFDPDNLASNGAVQDSVVSNDSPANSNPSNSAPYKKKRQDSKGVGVIPQCVCCASIFPY